jgi:hypothetical protein
MELVNRPLVHQSFQGFDEMLTHLWSRGLLRFPTLSDAAQAEMLKAAEAGELELRQVVRAHAPNSRAKKDAILTSLRHVRATIGHPVSMDTPLG